jgi:hypothetical protein
MLRVLVNKLSLLLLLILQYMLLLLLLLILLLLLPPQRRLHVLQIIESLAVPLMPLLLPPLQPELVPQPTGRRRDFVQSLCTV